MIPFNHCPHCRGIRFLAGPRGGGSQNVTCMGCGARLNLVMVLPPLPGGPFLLLEELSPPTGAPPDTSGGHYIIELLPEPDNPGKAAGGSPFPWA